MQITQWFKPGTNPVRRGVYCTGNGSAAFGITYQYWTGYFWASIGVTPSHAFDCRKSKSVFQHNHWCGLAVKP
jgi:hypothetical protein